MKTLLKYSAAIVLGALITTRLGAALESVKISPTFTPSLTPGLLARGVTEGKVSLVIDVSEEGKVTDWLVLGYSEPEFVAYFIGALKGWDITPARLDGHPVAAQVEVVANISAQGVVLSRTAMEMENDFVRRLHDSRLQLQISLAGSLDRAPARLNTITPKYAFAAEQQGVRGRVQVRFYIDEHGTVRMPAVDPGAHPYLAGQALAAVREWKFEPPMSKGKPVLVAASQEFNFSGAR